MRVSEIRVKRIRVNQGLGVLLERLFFEKKKAKNRSISGNLYYLVRC